MAEEITRWDYYKLENTKWDKNGKPM